MKRKYYWIYINIIFFIITVDFYSKKWILNHLNIYEKQKVFFILNLFHVHNFGAAFSILSDQNGWQKYFLLIFSIIIILAIIKIMIKFKKKDKNKILSYSLILAGAIGNLIDRINYGFVIDFIDLHFKSWHFATFNIADFSIFIGMIMIIKKNYYNS
ncbi:signal peptidase II [Buchnera aphidicola]|jgi:signal peptidase II|uniref:Lipoprotein signal peptidase n=1 Tax=Buchnera aphidicola subsp. Schizaphis graminum (strain Sg) TaxID=198804 RepID=LSPA_BUCAP|nr:signal peptidase II [Buchnera aphidicola]Q8K9Z3.1 RecName: Full=Lipoprotein signal peptidase; AltName: Full=Prolipoprotein signal peptidase; AltName: Full=Signal peptidase II; Short=SPase II [Buchnera aphidicola str. Sg (Schizaphis graminum)]AAM67709.1 lipoprotein signal peptidase [Buchnera aphidicola str. Sg (Schizaphis graminum)]AWI49794.1 lipoprotein signal peptidase [Buchnera aphidicola (Schizaphis graminum)]